MDTRQRLVGLIHLSHGHSKDTRVLIIIAHGHNNSCPVSFEGHILLFITKQLSNQTTAKPRDPATAYSSPASSALSTARVRSRTPNFERMLET
jgi:hypothetical protein